MNNVLMTLMYCILHLVCNARVLPRDSSVFTTDNLPDEPLAATIGNGYTGMIVGTQEQSQYMYINGVWNGISKYQSGKSSLKSHKAAIPNTNYISLTFRDYDSNDINITYTLDVNNAVFSFIYQHKQYYWTVQQMIFTHRLYKNLVVTQINVNINNSATNKDLLIEVNNLNYNRSSTDVNMTDVTNNNTICKNNNYLCFSGFTQLSEDNVSLIEIGVLTFKNSTNSFLLNVSSMAKDSIFYFPTVLLTSLESNNIINDMYKMFTDDLLPMQNKWLKQHIDEWDYLWLNGRIDINDDIKMAGNVYSSIYYLLSSIRDDWCYGITPGSIATNGYNGRIFWDQEIWILPSLLLLQTSIANCILFYRYNTLNGAYLNGNFTGYPNTARYAWQSGFTGLEITSDVEGNNSILINGAIPWAINKYYDITKNKTWLKDIGFPMLFGISNFWIQRVDRFSENLYGYADVTGPDTSHQNVNNSGYTNMVALETLNYSMKAANILNVQYPDNWKIINYSNIVILYDSQNKYHPEYEGYKFGESVKQPGIIYFGYPYNYFYRISNDKEIYLNDLNSYYNVSTLYHTMQWSMFMINYMILKKYDLAMQSFKYALASLPSNGTNPFRVWTEGSDGSDCNHFVTDQGGFVQTFLFGFGGFNINDNYLEINTQFMPYKQMNFIGVYYQNNNIDFNIFNVSQSTIIVNITVTECVDVDKYSLLILYENDTKNYTLKVNETISISNIMQPAKIIVSHNATNDFTI